MKIYEQTIIFSIALSLTALTASCQGRGQVSTTPSAETMEPTTSPQNRPQKSGDTGQSNNQKAPVLKPITCNTQDLLLDQQANQCDDNLSNNLPQAQSLPQSDDLQTSTATPINPQKTPTTNCSNLGTASLDQLVECLRSEVRTIENWFSSQSLTSETIKEHINYLYQNTDQAQILHKQNDASAVNELRFCLALTFSRTRLTLLNSEGQRVGVDLKELMTVVERQFLIILDEAMTRAHCDPQPNQEAKDMF